MADAGGDAFGNLLRRYRFESGLTQEELAERAAISARTVSDIERGLRSTVYRDTARRLADAFNLEGPDRERSRGPLGAARPEGRPRGIRHEPRSARFSVGSAAAADEADRARR